MRTSKVYFATLKHLLIYSAIFFSNHNLTGQDSTVGALDYSSKNVSELRIIGDKMYFVIGDELWSSDGTSMGAHSLDKLLLSGYYLGELNGEMIFRGRSKGSNIDALWRTDGSLSGTTMLQEIVDNNLSYSYYNEEAKMDNRLWFFFADSISGRELWSTDGTAAGTLLAFESQEGPNSIFNHVPWTKIISVGQRLFFSQGEEGAGQELWISDGTKEGSHMLKDIRPGRGSSTPNDFSVAGSKVYFGAVMSLDTAPFQVLTVGVSYGTTEGTIMIAETRFNPGVLVGQHYFFGNEDGLWKTDGTADGTEMIHDGFVFRDEIVALGDHVIFTSHNAEDGTQAWITDGTIEGTRVLKDVIEPEFWGPQNYTKIGEELFINAFKLGSYLPVLLRINADLHATSTPMTIDGNILQSIGHIHIIGNRLFFSAFSGLYGRDVYYIDLEDSPATATSNKETSSISISPNPTTRYLHIEMHRVDHVDVRIFDLSGQTFMLSDHTSNQIPIDLGALPPGLYYLQIKSRWTNSHLLEKIVKL